MRGPPVTISLMRPWRRNWRMGPKLAQSHRVRQSREDKEDQQRCSEHRRTRLPLQRRRRPLAIAGLRCRKAEGEKGGDEQVGDVKQTPAIRHHDNTPRRWETCQHGNPERTLDRRGIAPDVKDTCQKWQKDEKRVARRGREKLYLAREHEGANAAQKCNKIACNAARSTPGCAIKFRQVWAKRNNDCARSFGRLESVFW